MKMDSVGDKATPERRLELGAEAARCATAGFRIELEGFRRLVETLAADVSSAIKQIASAAGKEGDDEEIQRATRTLARALFACIEGAVYGMKQTAHEVDRRLGRKFTPGETAVLLETEFGLEENGKARTRPARLRTVPNLRFAFDAFARSFDSGYALRTEGEDWERFQRAIKVRDRLTHPKRIEQLLVTKEEVLELVAVWSWFHAAFKAVFESANEGAGDAASPPCSSGTQPGALPAS